MRLGPTILCSFILLLCTCDPAPQRTARSRTPSTLTGALRYQQSGRTLEATLLLSPVASRAPLLLGEAVPALPAAGPGNYQLKLRQTDFPTDLSVIAPCGEDGAADCQLALPFVPPFIDSLPATVARGRTLRFAAAPVGLTANENLVVFFEPTDRSRPRRLLVQGPTSSGVVTLPKKALGDIPRGQYEVYLIKQQLNKDSTATLRHSLQTEYFTRMRPVTVTE